MPETISYKSDDWHRRSFIKWRYLVIGTSGIVLLVLGLSPISIRADRMDMCSICGSRHEQADWAFGVTTGKTIQSSALDAWIAKNLGGHTHQWKHMSSVGRNLFSAPVYRACSSAPPVFACRTSSTITSKENRHNRSLRS
jgi:hypothetical protein